MAAMNPINLNIANREELGKVLGLGPDLTDDLINYRELNGPFRSWESLKSIQGITDFVIWDIKKNGAKL